MIALISAIVCAFCAVLNRALKALPTPIILFYHSILGLILAFTYILIEAWITGNGFRFPTYTNEMLMITAGASVFDAFACLLATLGQQSASASFVSLLSYLNIVYGYICDLVFFHTGLNSIELLAAIVIFLTALAVAYKKLR